MTKAVQLDVFSQDFEIHRNRFKGKNPAIRICMTDQDGEEPVMGSNIDECMYFLCSSVNDEGRNGLVIVAAIVRDKSRCDIETEIMAPHSNLLQALQVVIMFKKSSHFSPHGEFSARRTSSIMGLRQTRCQPDHTICAVLQQSATKHITCQNTIISLGFPKSGLVEGKGDDAPRAFRFALQHRTNDVR